MAGQLDLVIRFIKKIASRTGGDTPDAQLLQRFVAGDERAFEELVQRHGAMVIGVCRHLKCLIRCYFNWV